MAQIYKIIAQNITRLRNTANLKQSELGALVHLDRVTISNIECGNGTASWKTLEKIATVLNTTLDDLCSVHGTIESSLNMVEIIKGTITSLSLALPNTVVNFNDGSKTLTEPSPIDCLLKKYSQASKIDQAVILDILDKGEQRLTALNVDRNTPIKSFCTADRNKGALKAVVKQIKLGKKNYAAPTARKKKMGK